MSSEPSKGNQIHPSITQMNDSGNGEEGNSGIQRKFSLLNTKSQGAKEFSATLLKNAKLEKDFKDCFPTPEQRAAFFRSTRFLEKHLVDFANKSMKLPRETLHFSREFLRGMRSYLEDDPVEDATAKEELDFDETEHEKVKVKEKEKREDPLNIPNILKKHSMLEQLAQRETAEIKFTFKRVIVSRHEPYELTTKDTVGKWLIGAKWAKRLMNTTVGLYAILWFIASIASVVLVALFLLEMIPDAYNLLLIVPFLLSIPYSLVIASSINVVLYKKLLREFMYWYTSLSFIVGATLAAVAFGGPQRLAVISLIPIGITSTTADCFPRFIVKNSWSGYISIIICIIVTIIALRQSPYDPKLDFHVPVFGIYNWTGVAISALYNYIIMMTKYLVVSLWDPKNFVILKVPLQSIKMMENRANMILVTAEKERLYKKIGEDGQKLITSIVGSPSDVPWELQGKSSKSMLFTRLRTNENHHITSEAEYKLEMYTKETLEQAYRERLHLVKDWKVMHEEICEKANTSPALPSMRILYRRVKVPYPGVSDRLLCVKSQYSYYPKHGLAIQVTHDAEKKYLDLIPKLVTKGTTVSKIRLAGYVLEKMKSRTPMTKVTHFVSSSVGGWIPVRARNFIVQKETKIVEKIWDKQKGNDEGSSLFRTEEAIENVIDQSERSTVGSTRYHRIKHKE
eukprot:g743.t1